jgi:uncharacterized protein YaaQ
MGTPSLDRLVILTVSGSQSGALMKALSRDGFQFTVIDSRGGMMQDTMVCLLIGFSAERMPILLEDVRKNCRSYQQYVTTQGLVPGELSNLPMVEARMGGALVYMMNVERFEQL